MKTPLGTEVDLGPGHIVLDGVPAPAKGAQKAPCFWPMSIVATVAHLSYCWTLVDVAFDKFLRICDQLATFLGQKQVTDTHLDIDIEMHTM